MRQRVAMGILKQLEKDCLESTDIEFKKAVHHIKRLSGASGSKKKFFSSYTTCGYLLEFVDTCVDSSTLKYMAYFVYMRLGAAVKIPSNKCAYHTFGALFGDHLTSPPIAYDDDYVYLKHPNLDVFAWGNGRSRARTWLEQRGYVIPGRQIVPGDIRFYFNHRATPAERIEMIQEGFLTV